MAYGPFSGFRAYCPRCRENRWEADVFVTFVHDVRCWGWRTAFYNLTHRGSLD